MGYMEDDYLMISGIQHFRFCRRQWALIHIEQQWAENVHTVVGELMHKKVHDPYLTEKRKDILITRALPVSSRTLGARGECDVVEFHKLRSRPKAPEGMECGMLGENKCEDGVKLYGHKGLYQVFPIEYKKGKPKVSGEDILQLTAQVMCLEEMFSTVVNMGALFYGETRRREVIMITEELRCQVKEMFQEMHQYYERRYTPKVKWSKSCNGCSLKEICLPKLGKVISVKDYINQALSEEGE